MPGIKRKEPQTQTAGQSPPKKFKTDGTKKPYSDKKFSKHDGDKKYSKKVDGEHANGDDKKPVVKELYDCKIDVVLLPAS